MSSHYAIVPAAGSGSRFGGDAPKQYQLLAGRPLLHHSLAALCRCRSIERVWVVLAPDDG
ncbi:MAG TPA: 2-C-methyl-D-erythritol 4-phosphate cytidylyltransferase, partial [Candidatus Accumulibacter sp.]|nr:2-C-methyl-D-erythritol 4-phosphate cytidylyltransferase [Accumulibacter sp.]